MVVIGTTTIEEQRGENVLRGKVTDRKKETALLRAVPSALLRLAWLSPGVDAQDDLISEVKPFTPQSVIDGWWPGRN